MTVEELIKELNKYPKDSQVYIERIGLPTHLFYTEDVKNDYKSATEKDVVICASRKGIIKDIRRDRDES